MHFPPAHTDDRAAWKRPRAAQKLLSYGNLHGGDVYDPETTLLQAAFTPTNLLTPSAEGDDGGDHDADEDGNGTTTVPLSGKPAGGSKGPRTVIDQMVDLICSAYSTEDLSSDKPTPSLIAIEQMVVKVQGGRRHLCSGRVEA